MIELLALIKVPSPAAEAIAAHYTVHQLPEPGPEREAMLAEVGPRIRGIVTGTRGFVREDLLERLPALEIVACYTAGVDPIDVEAVKRRGIALFNNSAALNDTVADFALALLLGVARDITGGDAHVRANAWPKGRYRPGNLLRGRKTGIVGLGGIGSAIAQRCVGFGMDLAYFGPRPKDVPYRYEPDLLALANWADTLILSCPGGPETVNLVNADVLKALGPQGWLINVARGSVVDETALIAALENGTLERAGLDVFANEPNVPAELMALDRVLLSPHQGSSSVEVLPLRAEIILGQLRDHFGN
jgi:lactate dehydrogenase-like 2-hydroxyacid dehydrogenase